MGVKRIMCNQNHGRPSTTNRLDWWFCLHMLSTLYINIAWNVLFISTVTVKLQMSLVTFNTYIISSDQVTVEHKH